MILDNIRPRRDVDAADFSDLTGSEQTGPAKWVKGQVDALEVPLDPSTTAEEAKAIRRRLVTVDAADEAQLLALIKAHKDSATPTWARPLIESAISAYGDLADLV